MTRWMSVGLCALLSACSNVSLEPRQELASTPTLACGVLDQEQQLAMRMVGDLVEQGRHHAALAHLAALPDEQPMVRLRQAKVLRSLKQPGSKEKFQSLSRTCLHAYGEQGLGQLAAEAGDYQQARTHLQRAANLEPTDADIRNDLGWIALSQGDLQKAHFELLTALELAPKDLRIASNVLTLAYLQGRPNEAKAMAERLGLPAAQVQGAQQQAEHLRARVASVPKQTVSQADVLRR